MAIIRDVLQNKMTQKWSYVEFSDEDEKVFTVLGNTDFETKEQAIEWAKGFAPESYIYVEPNETKAKVIQAEIDKTETYLQGLKDQLTELTPQPKSKK